MVEEGAGAAAEGAGAVAGAAGGTANDGEEAAAEGDATGAGGGVGTAAGGDKTGVGGGAVASLDCRKICSWMKEFTDDITVSVRWRRPATPSKYPETCWPTVTTPRKA